MLNQQILHLRSEKPTTLYDWNDRVPTFMGAEAFHKVDYLFDHFIEELAVLPDDAPANQKLQLFQSAVEDVNALNEKYKFFIEQEEGEEVSEFFNEAAETAGLNLEVYENQDITYQWRRNW